MTRRAAGYSRYSTDLQNERSIEDQQALLNRYAGLNDLRIVRHYADAAQSGASILGRDGLLEMLADAKAAAFDVVIVEELDRLSRDMEDLAGIHKRLSFAGVEIVAVHEGVASTVTVGLRGLVGQLFREDNARKVRRGLAGKVSQGMSAGGRAFGYRADPASPGRLIVIEEEAEVVRRIFAEYVAGRSPRAIAQGLNRDGAPTFRAAAWTASSIAGWEERKSGILRNGLYAGRIVWNKTRMVKDPETGRRVPRPNPEADWRTAEAPELRIVEPDLWERVQALLAPVRRSKSDCARMRRPTRPLSGLLRCGSCGGGMSVVGKDKSGRIRLACSRHLQSRTCPAPRTWYLDRVEAAVIGMLRDELDNPEHLRLYVEQYNRARREFAEATAMRRRRLERRVADLDQEIGRLIDFIARGIGNADRIAQDYTARCDELEAAKRELAAEPPALDAVALHPLAIDGYRRDLAALAPAMATDRPDADGSFAEILRRLIDSVVVSESEGRQMIVTVHGRLRQLIEAPAVSRVLNSLVARDRLNRFQYPEPLFVLRRAA